MIKIFLKDFKNFLIFGAVLTAPSAILWSIKKTDEIFPVAVFVQLAFTFIITALSVMISEQNEDTHSGYTLYMTLPVTRRAVTFTKFLFPIVILLLLWGANRLIYSMFPVGPDILAQVDSITLAFSVFFLLNAGAIYLGIWLLGYPKFIQFSSGALAVFVFGSFVLSKLGLFNLDKMNLAAMANSVEHWLLHGNHLKFLAAGLAVYLTMGIAANRIEKK